MRKSTGRRRAGQCRIKAGPRRYLLCVIRGRMLALLQPLDFSAALVEHPCGAVQGEVAAS